MQAFIRACGSAFLWVYIERAAIEIFTPTEGMRHWGMVCSCPEHIKMRHDGQRHIDCWKNSRRLRDAWPFVEKEIALVDARCNTITPADVEDNALAHITLQNQLKGKVSGLRMRCKYLRLVPWLFANGDTQEGAAECMRQVRARPLEEHDPVTQSTVRQFGGAMDRVAAGEEPTPEWLAEVELFNLACLDESCGEGYHRGTSQELSRAPASGNEHLKRANRFQQERLRVRNFAKHMARRVRKSCVLSGRTTNAYCRRSGKDDGPQSIGRPSR